MNDQKSKRVRRTQAEVAAELEQRAALLRGKVDRRKAIESSKVVKKMLSTATAIRAICNSHRFQDGMVVGSLLVCASDLEKEADLAIGQYRLDRDPLSTEGVP